MDDKVVQLEKRVREMEKNNATFQAELKELKVELDLSIKKTLESLTTNQGFAGNEKINYLQEVNEQMFQQNLRLRNLIEKCIQNHIVPTQDQYYEALREDTT
ncbi:hypothetical protein GMD78_09145 [Ornithinibacillus sp. L9]|uniref:Uncharacterized protein n=1 Tax=Ornithinibacillus caprae TaxID=2678566 RepID=A0A6N8FJR2_9BACI|nr:hypothetical protein [Ornithinibacillus caprae]MUK88554.1 hypothetical protein [Ornithinibacillus caprae]